MPLTDVDAACEAIAAITTPSKEQEFASQAIAALLSTDDPFIDVNELFKHYNTLYFRSLLLPRVTVYWSSRLTRCAGICELVKDPENNNKYTKIRLKLSEALLKFRTRDDVVNTLLHEAVHAYFFVTTEWRHCRGEDGSGHGDGFLLLADAINSHGGYNVTVYHYFLDEVDSYRTHVWQCDGPCVKRGPFYGLVKRAMNRAPGKSDDWWAKHQDECGGTFTKIASPDLTKAQVEKLSVLKRAGLQKNKIDNWVVLAKRPNENETIKHDEHDKSQTEESAPEHFQPKRARTVVVCPICSGEVDEARINEHLDQEHP